MSFACVTSLAQQATAANSNHLSSSCLVQLPQAPYVFISCVIICRQLQGQLAASEDNAQQLQHALAVAQARKTQAEQARSEAQTASMRLQEQLELSEDSAASLQVDLEAAQARAAAAEQANVVLARSQVGSLTFT